MPAIMVVQLQMIVAKIKVPSSIYEYIVSTHAKEKSFFYYNFPFKQTYVRQKHKQRI